VYSAENGISNALPMARHWLPVLLALALIPLVGACGLKGPGSGSDVPEGDRSAREAERQQRAEATARRKRKQVVDRCLREGPALEAEMAALRRAESQLARVKEETYAPLPPPAPWDETSESRFRQEDREVDWQRHLQEQDDWQRREESRRSRWLADHDSRLREAQERLNLSARGLRSRQADLFTGPGSIEFNPEVAERIRQCGKT
jgi:predicted small lipoprotein YifL